MTDAEHKELFLYLQDTKIEAFRLASEININININNLESIKIKLEFLKKVYNENKAKYQYDHNLNGELIDLLRGISRIEIAILAIEK